MIFQTASIAGFVLLVQAATASDQFHRGKTAYDRGEYARAVQILRPLLYPDLRLESEAEVVQAHRMLGVAHLFEKQDDLAAQEFRKLLRLRPDYRMDALLDSPQVVDFFNGVLREQEEELARLEARRKVAEAAQRKEREALERARHGPLVVEKRYMRQSFVVNFIPFGAGQFQNGHRRKGWAFLLGESLLGSISVAAMATNFALYGVRPKLRCVPVAQGELSSAGCAGGRIDRTDQERSQLLLKAQLASGSLFFAAVAWGIADAIWHFRPEVPIGARDIDLGLARGGIGAFRLAPLALDGGGMGAGLGFRF